MKKEVYVLTNEKATYESFLSEVERLTHHLNDDQRKTIKIEVKTILHGGFNDWHWDKEPNKPTLIISWEEESPTDSKLVYVK